MGEEKRKGEGDPAGKKEKKRDTLFIREDTPQLLQTITRAVVKTRRGRPCGENGRQGGEIGVSPQ